MEEVKKQDSDYLEINFSKAFKTTWEKFKENLGVFIGLSAILYMVVSILFALGFFGVLALMASGSTGLDSIDNYDFSGSDLILLIFSMMFTIIATVVIGSRFMASLTWAALKIIESGKNVSFSDAWEGGKPYYKNFLITSLLAGMIIASGFLLLIVPGVIFLSWYLFATQVAVHKNLSGMEALSESKRILSERGWTVLGYAFIFGLISGAAGIIPILGDIVSLIIGLLQPLFFAYLYFAVLKERGESFEFAMESASTPKTKPENVAKEHNEKA
jgi:hypothetical protein